jgi:hypothetical protein
MRETPSADYIERTEWNVRDSNATLILFWGEITGGTMLTVDIAREYNRPLLLVDMTAPLDLTKITNWIRGHNPATLNIAGSRESTNPGVIYNDARKILLTCFVVKAR